MKFITAIFVFCLATISLSAQQIKTPAASPRISITQTVGLSKISLDYSRPSAKGRTIFGADGLVQNGKMWRLGANASTKITFEEAVTIDGKSVPAGEYALYAIPNADLWTFIIHKNTSYWGVGQDYTSSEDLMRLTAKPQETSHYVETLDIGINSIAGDKAHLVVQWENTQVEFPIQMEVDARVMANIKDVMEGTSRADYYTAARYFYDNGKDLSQALSWIKKANDFSAKYWQLRLQSEIEAKLGDYTTAVKTAATAKEAASKAGNEEYVRIITDNVAMWKKEMGKRS